MELLLCEIAGCPRQPAGTDVAENIRSVIQSNPEQFFSNLDLAQMNDVSVKTAETRFKAMFGKTIHQYMLEFKIREAISYFTFFPEITIRQVASNLGFYDEYHFSKQFKRFTGRSPSAWKKEKNGGISSKTPD